MKQINNILNKIKNNFKFQILLCVLLCTIVITTFLISYKIIDIDRKHNYTIIDDISIINSVEEIDVDNRNIILEGYAFMLGKDSADVEVSLFLLDVDEGDEVWADTEAIVRTDVDSYFSSKYNYERSGFRALLKDKKVNSDACYEVILNVDYRDENSIDNHRKTVTTNRFLFNGKLYDYNPNEFFKPNLDVKSTLLKKVFLEGHLHFYLEEEGLYLYQYEDKLFWIATSDFKFDKNLNTYIAYQIFTSQTNKLSPEHAKYGFENLDFYFEQYEYRDEETEPYRVAIQKIPDDYAINYIKTGHYDLENNTWIWNKNFHIFNLNEIIN